MCLTVGVIVIEADEQAKRKKETEKWKKERGEDGIKISSLLPIFATSQGKEVSVHLSSHSFCCRPFICVTLFLEGTHM